MDKPYDEHFNKKAGVERLAVLFEKMLETGQKEYFDEENYEDLSFHYLKTGNEKMAKIVAKTGYLNFQFSVDLAINYIQILVDYNEYQQALEIQTMVANVHPFNQELKFLKATILSESENYKEAIMVYNELLPIVEDKRLVLVLIAQTYQDWGKYKKAALAYEDILIQFKHDEPTLDEYIDCLDHVNEVERAVDFFKEAIDTDPYNHVFWFYLGVAYNHLRQFDAAKTAFDYSVTIKEDFASGWCHLGHAYIALEEFDLAKKAYKNTLIHEDPTAEVYTYLGIAYEQLRNHADAYKYFKLATGLDNTWFEAWYGLASLLYDQEKYYEAVHFINKAIKFNKYNGDFWLLLAECETKLGNPTEGQAAYEQAAQLSPFEPDVWLNWSLALFEEGNYNAAFSVVKEGIEELPEEADLYFRAVAYLIYDGRLNLANNYLIEGLNLDYDKHIQIYDFFTNLDTQKSLQRIISQFKN